ncbi:MAG: hypothetical protein ACR2F8_05035 [Caulobacteraceae bacterium]
MSELTRAGGGDILSTNLFPCALEIAPDKKSRSPLNSPNDLKAILDWQRGFLTGQIAILKPTAIIFFTGPNYDFVIKDEFIGVEFPPIDNRPWEKFARVVHEHLPKQSFRTYHPEYLFNRHSAFAPWVAELSRMAATS